MVFCYNEVIEAGSSSGPGHLVFSQRIRGSNPLPATDMFIPIALLALLGVVVTLIVALVAAVSYIILLLYKKGLSLNIEVKAKKNNQPPS